MGKKSIVLGNYPVGENLQRIICEKAMSSTKLSRVAGLPDRCVSDFITGNRIIRASDIDKLAKAIGVEVGEFFK